MSASELGEEIVAEPKIVAEPEVAIAVTSTTAPQGCSGDPLNVNQSPQTRQTLSYLLTLEYEHRLCGSSYCEVKLKHSNVKPKLATLKVALLAPFSAFYALVLQLFFGIELNELDPDSFILQRWFWVQVKTRSVLTVASRLGLPFLILTPCLLASKTATLSGLRLWEWSMFATLICLGYPYLYFMLSIFVTIAKNLVHPTNTVIIYSFCGLLDSVAALLHGCFLITLWMLHYPHDRHHNKYVTWTLAAGIVAAGMSIIKSAVLMWWTVKAVFERFRDRSLIAAFRLYFLICILDRGCSDESLLPWKECNLKFEAWMAAPLDDPKLSIGPLRTQKRNIIFDNAVNNKRDVHRYILSRHVSFDQMKELTQLLVDLAKSTKGKDKRPVRAKVEDAYHRRRTQRLMSEANINAIIDGEYDRVLLKAALKAEFPLIDIRRVYVDKWVVDTNERCVDVGYTLFDAFEMVNVLDKILNCFIVAIVVLFWLMITHVATTKVLLVIASQFFALAFVFGETFKTLFKGFIFAFISHPYYIGDRCIINKVEVEVKRINILTTTCIKMGTNEKMVYPNSMLANSLIINLGHKLDPRDLIVIALSPSTPGRKISELKYQIVEYLKQNAEGPFERSCKVVTDNNGHKISIRFQHKMDGRDFSQSQFLEKKQTQKSFLYKKINKLLDNLEIQVVSPSGGATRGAAREAAPAGEAGPTGDAGPTGEAGPAGEAGHGEEAASVVGMDAESVVT